MKTTPTQPVTTGASFPDARPAFGNTLIPTGEAQVGVVKQAQPVEAERPQPVLEHPIAPSEAAATTPAHAAPPATDVQPAASPGPSVSERAAALAAVAQKALQDLPQVSIPERMDHLHTENKTVRDRMQVLEKTLKKSLN